MLCMYVYIYICILDTYIHIYCNYLGWQFNGPEKY